MKRKRDNQRITEVDLACRQNKRILDVMISAHTDAEWREQLTPEQYHVLREKGTEPAFSGQYDSVFDPGTYSCAACGAALFESGTKFDAHCGWPSFYDAKPGAVVMTPDDSHGMSRTEVTCAQCGGHLGHVFAGEGHGTPTDQRYCINSLSLQFTPDSLEKKP